MFLFEGHEAGKANVTEEVQGKSVGKFSLIWGRIDLFVIF